MIDPITEYILQEQFDPSLAISSAMGHYNVNWTTCYDTKCSGQELKFDKAVCKQACVISSASASIAEISRVRSLCGEVKRPGACLKRLNKGIERLRDKITKARDKQRKELDKKAEYLRKMAGGT